MCSFQPWRYNANPAPGSWQQQPQPEGLKKIVPWGVGDIFAVVGLVIAVFLLFSAALGTIFQLLSSLELGGLQNLINSPLANSLFWLMQWSITLGITFTYFKLRGYQITFNQLGFRKTAAGQAALLIIGILVGSFIFQAIYITYVTEPRQEPVTGLFGTTKASFILAIIIVSILTPIVEEMFFRGIIHQGLEQRLGFLPGALISASIFMLAHMDPTVFLPIFVLGIGFAGLMSQTKSVWPSIIAHALWNSLGVITQFLGN